MILTVEQTQSTSAPYFVVIDQELPISPFYSTRSEARAAKHGLIADHPGARVREYRNG